MFVCLFSFCFSMTVGVVWEFFEFGADMLFEKATHVNFFVGQGVNAAHQELPIDITMKLKLVESLTKNLEKMGKTVSVKYN